MCGAVEAEAADALRYATSAVIGARARPAEDPSFGNGEQRWHAPVPSTGNSRQMAITSWALVLVTCAILLAPVAAAAVFGPSQPLAVTPRPRGAFVLGGIVIMALVLILFWAFANRPDISRISASSGPANSTEAETAEGEPLSCRQGEAMMEDLARQSGGAFQYRQGGELLMPREIWEKISAEQRSSLRLLVARVAACDGGDPYETEVTIRDSGTNVVLDRGSGAPLD